MRAVFIKDFIANCRGGGEKTKAWAPSAASEIVVHRRIGWLSDDFILSHRRSGLTIKSMEFNFKTRAEALEAAKKIMNFPEWKVVGRPDTFDGKVPGWNRKIAKALNRRLRVLTEV